MEKVKVGIIGCGNISQAYFNGMKQFEILEVKSCADLNMDVARNKAEENGVNAVTVDEILADPDIEIIANLTIPRAHVEVGLKCVEAGKHVHAEKPFGIDTEDAKKLVAAAKEKELLLGCAPDTFFGGGHQTSRKLIDDGWIGKPIAGVAFMMCHGHESWHPNPSFYYDFGGGPMLDMGPYYLTALVNMLGPAKRICACTAKSFDERVATSQHCFGLKIPVKIETHQAGTIEFQNGAIVTVIMSFDIWRHSMPKIEIHGTEGSLNVPDPNGFGGEVKVFRPGNEEWNTCAKSHGYNDNMRGIGVADMAYALRYDRKNRCSGDLAYHVLEMMTAFEKSSKENCFVELESTCERPEALPMGLVHGTLDQ